MQNESEVVKSLIGVGSYGEFPIYIMQFGPVFWIRALEFDTIGYFADAESAIAYAEFNYEPFITAAVNAERTGEEDGGRG